ncbi:conjugative relaxase [Loktanella sp. IMCC34160]|uniref:MobF family relaxase n=1 Tax=Loktanella sp. IMCC34160 TaxID=2510646 RepID=UPI00101C8762|nr:MobF family relaxase [Loktanella sp. IMCC34160]RYG90081.1 conjugative relaxase [Loktanella sp. IMCC34160]
MMAATPVSPGAAASGYYKSEGYYKAGSPEADAAAEWFGKAANELGLAGRVDDALFASMLEGQTYEKAGEGLTKGRLMGRYVDGERQHRAGLDLTFSAPKSLSVAALVFGDNRLIEAHDKAVRTAMHYVEAELIQTRRAKNGEIDIVTGGKIIAGLFRHDSSRALDPQLHTHAVIANMVKNPDGHSTALYTDLLFRTQKLGSEIYRNELARDAAALGYRVERQGKDQLVELKDVPPELTARYSKRRAEIEKALAGRGMADTAKTAELAALATRTAKTKDLDRQELKAAWEREAEATGIDKDQMARIVQATKERAQFHVPGVVRSGSEAPAPSDAVASLRQAIAHISETAVHYSEKDLIGEALKFANTADLGQIENAIAEAKREYILVPAKVVTAKEPQWTDVVTLTQERAMARLFRQGQKVAAIRLPRYYDRNGTVDRRPQKALEKRLSQTSLTPGQKNAVTTALTGQGRVVGVQGYAGTGKTFALAHLVKEAQRAGYTVEGVAPSAQAVAQLSEALPTSETLQARLLRQRSADRDNDPRKTILVVDEASMVSTKQMRTLLHQAEESKIARVVLVGDVQQLDSVAAGTPFALLQRLGMRTAVMDDIQRQRNVDALAVVNHAIAGEVQEAFRRIQNIDTPKEGAAVGAAQRWLALDADQRRTTGLVTPSNRTREAINTEIRDGLKAEGTLGLEDRSLPTLTPLRMSRAQVADPRSYRIGDIVIPHQSVKAAGLVRGHQYEVVEITGKQTGLILKDMAGGAALPFSPQQNSKAAASVDVYEPSQKDFAENERIKFRIADKSLRIKNGDTGQIVQTDGDQIHIRMSDSTIRALPLDSLAARGLDHGYALTAHDFQGATVDRIIVAMTANETLADQKNFYVAVSRARDEITLVTDKPEDLARRLEEQTGQKITALEAWIDAEKDLRGAEAAKDADKVEKAEVPHKDNREHLLSASERTDETHEDRKDSYRGPEAARMIDRERGDWER